MVDINIRENEVETEDSFFSLGFNGLKNYNFFDINEKRTYEKSPTEDFVYMAAEIFLDESIIYHGRSAYGLLDLFGDVGGVM
jgi:hypothetical protein